MQESNSHSVDRAPSPKKRITMRRNRLVSLVITGCLLLGAAGIYIYSTYGQTVIKPEVVASAKFPVYAPNRLPSGYSVEDDRTTLTDEVLTYTLVNKDQNRGAITVTVQPSPPGFDMSKMIGDGSITSAATDAGTLYNLTAGDATKYLIDAGGTLVFLTASSRIDTATINSFANSLKKLN